MGLLVPIEIANDPLWIFNLLMFQTGIFAEPFTYNDVGKVIIDFSMQINSGLKVPAFIITD